ncbi:MAG: dephospho-CoA kinase [Clostridia bacterium]|nr:dephospho-CoA kinase [Clostridia bacterium]
MKIAITGGIGSGKSLVGEIIKEKGYPVFSCDEIYNELIKEKEYIEKLKRLFPITVKGGKIDKKALSDTVFSDDAALAKLNQLAHPMIMERLHKQMHNVDSQKVFAEVPLLFEGNYQSEFDKVIVVTRPLSDRIKAVCLRDGVSEREVENRMAKQYDYDQSLDELIENYIILKNCGDISALRVAVEECLLTL